MELGFYDLCPVPHLGSTYLEVRPPAKGWTLSYVKLRVTGQEF